MVKFDGVSQTCQNECQRYGQGLEYGLWLDAPVADEALRLLTKAGGGKTAAMTPPPLMYTDDDFGLQVNFRQWSASGNVEHLNKGKRSPMSYASPVNVKRSPAVVEHRRIVDEKPRLEGRLWARDVCPECSHQHPSRGRVDGGVAWSDLGP